MLSKLFTKPLDDTLSISQLDQLVTLIESRITDIATSQDYVGKSRCCADPDNNLLYFLKTENPLDGVTFIHPTTRKPSSILSSTSQAGRVACAFISFASTADFYTVKTEFDYTRWLTFSKLQPTAWVNVPATQSDNTLLLPRQFKPDVGDVCFVNSVHFKILKTEEYETHNVCQIQPQEVA